MGQNIRAARCEQVNQIIWSIFASSVAGYPEPSSLYHWLVKFFRGCYDDLKALVMAWAIAASPIGIPLLFQLAGRSATWIPSLTATAMLGNKLVQPATALFWLGLILWLGLLRSVHLLNILWRSFMALGFYAHNFTILDLGHLFYWWRLEKSQSVKGPYPKEQHKRRCTRLTFITKLQRVPVSYSIKHQMVQYNGIFKIYHQYLQSEPVWYILYLNFYQKSQ